MSRKIHRLANKLNKALQKGRLEDALKFYGALESEEPDEPRWPHRKGDLLRRLEKKKEAVTSYERAVDLYTAKGFVARAVAMAKVVLEVDGHRDDLLDRLSPEVAQELHRKTRTTSLRPPSLVPPPPIGVPVVDVAVIPAAPPKAVDASSNLLSATPMLSAKSVPPLSAAPFAPLKRPAPPMPPSAPRPKTPAPPLRQERPAPPKAALDAGLEAAAKKSQVAPPLPRKPTTQTQAAPKPPAPPSVQKQQVSRPTDVLPNGTPSAETDVLPKRTPSAKTDLLPKKAATAATELLPARGPLGAEPKKPGSPKPLPPPSPNVVETEMAPAGMLLDDEPLELSEEDFSFDDVAAINLDINEVEFVTPRTDEIRGLEELSDADILLRERGSTVEELAKLPGFPLFSELPPAVLKRLPEIADLIQLDPGDVVFEKGHAAYALYAIVEGTVAIELGKEELLVGEGDTFGELCLAPKQRRRATVRAKTALTALRIPKSELDALIEEYPPFSDTLFELVSRKAVGHMMRTSPLFTAFMPSVRAELAKLFEARNAKAGTVIIDENKRADGIYCLLSGLIELTHDGSTHKLGPVTTFGHKSLLSRKPLGYRVTCPVDSLVLRLPAAAFGKVASANQHALPKLKKLAKKKLSPAVREHGVV